MKTLDDILHELSPFFDEELLPDPNNACVLVINENLRIQLEIDISGEFLLLGCFIVELPPGRFRENVLKSALKANDVIDQSPGILAFVARANQLVLFEQIHTSEISGEKLYEEITAFYSKADGWKTAIQGGQSHPESAFPQSTSSGGPPMFGMR